MAPLSGCAGVILNVRAVAPTTSAKLAGEPRCHCTASVPELQVAATVNVACVPATTLVLAGCCVIVNTGTAAVTVRVAALLVAVPAMLVTTARKVAPLSPSTAAGRA